MIIDLAKAQFFFPTNNSWQNQFGAYDFATGVVYGLHGWPDFFLPYALDPAVTYTIRYKYDPLSTFDTGGRGLWITGLRVGHVTADYHASGHFGEIYNNTSASAALDDVTITIGPGINTGTHGGWDGSLGPASGYVIPYFESNHIGALSYLEITPDPTPVAPTAWPENPDLVSGHNTAALPGAAGAIQPYWPRYWKWTPSVAQDVTFDTLSSLAPDLTVADTQIWVFRGPDFEIPNFVIWNDDANVDPNDLLSQVTFHAYAGVEYHIRVGTYDNTGTGITLYDLNAPFTGGGGGGGGGPHDPDPPDPELAYYLTEIVSTLSPATGKVPETYAWTQVSPGSPLLDLKPDRGTLRFINPPLLADTDFVVRLTVTDNLGGVLTEDHTIHIKAHHEWALRGGDVRGIQTVRDLSTRYVHYEFSRSDADLLAPYEYVAVHTSLGEWVATFTVGARSALIRRDTPSGSIPMDTFGGTITSDSRLLMLPAPFDGEVDEVLLGELLDSDDLDLFDIVALMANHTVTMLNGVQVFGPATYDATADFNDYLGITFAGDAPDLAKTGKLSPAGFIRLAYGPVGVGLPLASIPAAMTDQVGDTAPGVNVIDPAGYAPDGSLLNFLQLGDVLGYTGPHGEHHVGIYVGRDQYFRRRFISMRPDTNGVAATDNPPVQSTVSAYSLPVLPQYDGWLRTARRY